MMLLSISNTNGEGNGVNGSQSVRVPQKLVFLSQKQTGFKIAFGIVCQ
jgi:hypothetical protein